MIEPQPARGRPSAGQAELVTTRVVDAAWQVLLTSGPEAFSLDRVAIAAHASKQTIYARFSGKLELLQALLASQLGTLQQEIHMDERAGSLEEAFTDLARRASASLSAPEALMLERLVDWIDSALTQSRDMPTRRMIVAEMHAMLCGQFEDASLRWGGAIADVPEAAAFWLDGLIGHLRGAQLDDARRSEWPTAFTRFFLRAVIG